MLSASLLLSLIGCGRTDPPTFHLDMTNVVDKQLAPDHQKAIADILAAIHVKSHVRMFMN